MKIAITGTMGAGKSTLSAYLIKKGYPVYDTDKWVHELYETDMELVETIRTHFGESVMEAGNIDRKQLAHYVFADRKRLDQLESWIFPRIFQKIETIYATQADALVFFEIPLLFEAQKEADFDLILMVDADPSIRMKRLLQRGMSEAEINKRLERHVPDAIKLSKSDYVLENNHDKASFYEKVDILLDILKGGTYGR